MTLSVHRMQMEFHFFFEKAKSLLSQKKFWISATILLVALLVILYPKTSYAVWPFDGQSLEDRAVRFIFGGIATLLATIVNTLGKIILFLIDILIAVAQYNDFGNAIPVEKGWKLVRDICNMFFIVVLLVSAFATIIGYESSFHYKQVLPKLLLMAVLINFSRTLMMVLVDFSQVIMLTFVNAFQQAAAGNFAQLFGLDKLLSVAGADLTQNVGDISGVTSDSLTRGDGAANLLNIISSYMLAIILCIIMTGVLLIMVLYIVARVVGLWMILIFSPAALFATALPGKMAKGLSSLTSDYWNRFTAMLSGGPIIAFFIWLTLATVQASGTDGLAGKVFHYDKAQGAGAVIEGFLTNIGNTQSIATFIIGIAMLLIGLEAAVSSTSIISSTAGDWAKWLKGKTIGAAKWAAAAPVKYPAKYGYKAGKAATIGTLRALDRELDISGAVGRSARNLPGLSKNKTLRDLQLKNRRAVAKEAKEDESFQQELATLPVISAGIGRKGWRGRHRQGEIDSERARQKTDAFFNLSKSAQLAEANMSYDETKVEAYTKPRAELQKYHFDRLKKSVPGISDAEANRRAKVMAQAKILDERRNAFGDSRKLNEKLARDEELKKIADDAEKNPILDIKNLNNNMAGYLADPNNLKNMADESKNSGMVMMSLLEKSGTVSVENGAIKVDKDQLNNYLRKVSDKTVKTNLKELGRVINGRSAKNMNEAKNYTNGMVFAQDAQGKNRVHLTDTGIALGSSGEENAMADLRKAVATPTNGKDPTGPSGLSKDMASAVQKSVKESVSIPKIFDEASGVKPEVVKLLSSDVNAGFGKALGAKNADQLNKELSTIMPIIQQLHDLDEEAQINIGSSMAFISSIGDRLANRWQEIIPEYKSQISKALELLVEREKELTSKATRSTEETRLLASLAAMRKAVATLPQQNRPRGLENALSEALTTP